MAAKRLSAAYLQATTWLHGQVPYLGPSHEVSTTEFAWDDVGHSHHIASRARLTQEPGHSP